MIGVILTMNDDYYMKLIIKYNVDKIYIILIFFFFFLQNAI